MANTKAKPASLFRKSNMSAISSPSISKLHIVLQRYVVDAMLKGPVRFEDLQRIDPEIHALSLMSFLKQFEAYSLSIDAIPPTVNVIYSPSTNGAHAEQSLAEKLATLTTREVFQSGVDRRVFDEVQLTWHCRLVSFQEHYR